MTVGGKFLLTLVVLGVLGVGAWQWWAKSQEAPGTPGGQGAGAPTAGTGQAPPQTPPGRPGTTQSGSAPAKPPLEAPEIVEPQDEAPSLGTPATYQPQGKVVEVEISEYAGYAGIVAANGGLEPNDASVFAKKHGFQVKLTVSEEESWLALNAGKMGASATTVDVLAAYGKQFEVVIPILIGYSRGADGIVVRSDIRSVNALKGRVLAAVQFTEAEFFLRYLAQEAGLPVHALRDLGAKPDPQSLNLVYCGDPSQPAELFLRHVKADHPGLAGFVGWAPATTEAVERAQGRAHLLTSNTNLLIVADVLVVNRGFAQQKPELVAGLVAGILEGNRMVRESAESHLDTIGNAFKWDREKTRAQLRQVHLANLPENMAFFSGEMSSAGSYGGIYQSAVYSYGRTIIKNPVDGDRFLALQSLIDIEKSGVWKDQTVAIAPIQTKAKVALEQDPLLSKNIRFLFAPNSADLDMKNADNLKNLEDVKRLVQVSPGSTLVLRGHVDNQNVPEIRRQGGDAMVRKAAVQAVELSKKRAAEIKRILADKHGVDAARLEVVGCGWDEPLGDDSDANRRVEVQWFTLE